MDYKERNNVQEDEELVRLSATHSEAPQNFRCRNPK